MSFLGALSVAIVCASGGAQASAPNDTQARTAFRSGQQHFRAGKFNDAITKFEKAYELKPHAAIFFNLARCHEELGHTTLALKAYRTYLHERPDAADREDVLTSIGVLERKLQAKGVQQLMVHAEPSDATVSIDGTVLGPAPVFIELGPGEHRLRIERAGLEPVSRSFVMSTERSLELAYQLQAPALPAFTLEAEVPAAAKAPPPLEPVAAAPRPVPLDTTSVATPAARVYPLRSAAWVPLTITALGAAGAATGFVVAVRAEQQLDAELAANNAVTPRAQTLARSGRTAQSLAWVGVGVAAAGAVTSVVFLAVSRDAKVVPTLSLAPGAASIGLTGVLP